MGFRTTLTTQYYGIELPIWFHEKYEKYYFIDGTLVSSKCEVKHFDEFEKDYQKALSETDFFSDNLREIHIVAMGEDGYVTKIIITKEKIKYIWFGIDDDSEADCIWQK